MRTYWGIFDGIVHQIDDHLDNEFCITFGKKQIVFMSCRDGMIFLFVADMLQSFGDNFLNQLGLHFQLHAALFDFSDRKEIFHQIMEPCGIIVNIAVHLLSAFCIQTLTIGEKNTGIAGYGSERCTQIVGNGAQKIGSQLFVFRLELGFFLLLCVSAVFQSQRTFTQNRQQHAVSKASSGSAPSITTVP